LRSNSFAGIGEITGAIADRGAGAGVGATFPDFRSNRSNALRWSSTKVALVRLLEYATRNIVTNECSENAF
jgi:hypothetical protein